MDTRQQRLAALNGESRVFVCASCGRVKHVKDAGARAGRTANLVCLGCAVFLRMGVSVVASLSDLPVWPRSVDIEVTMPGEVRVIPIKMEVS